MGKQLDHPFYTLNDLPVGTVVRCMDPHGFKIDGVVHHHHKQQFYCMPYGQHRPFYAFPAAVIRTGSDHLPGDKEEVEVKLTDLQFVDLSRSPAFVVSNPEGKYATLQ